MLPIKDDVNFEGWGGTRDYSGSWFDGGTTF